MNINLIEHSPSDSAILKLGKIAAYAFWAMAALTVIGFIGLVVLFESSIFGATAILFLAAVAATMLSVAAMVMIHRVQLRRGL